MHDAVFVQELVGTLLLNRLEIKNLTHIIDILPGFEQNERELRFNQSYDSMCKPS